MTKPESFLWDTVDECSELAHTVRQNYSAMEQNEAIATELTTATVLAVRLKVKLEAALALRKQQAGD